MQFSELYTDRLDEELGDNDSTRLFTTARRKFAVNEGLRQFADLTECYTRDSSITCSNGTNEYNLMSTVNVPPSGDFVRLAKQKPEYRLKSSGSSGSTQYVSGDDFRRTTVEWLDQYEPGWRNSTGGTPRFYYERMDGGQRLIGLYPPPRIKNSSETGTLRLPYVARPSSMASDTSIPFTQGSTVRRDLTEYQQALVHYAAHQLEKLRVNTEQSNTQFQVFMGYVQRFLSAMRPKGGTTVKVARSYFGQARARGGWNGPRPWRTDLYGDR